ncbi:unnamed protein product [Polarella glacialis]|uniref:ABC transporter domain-containing protein n=1 Tax=Polarella glacialis TaxID=89957 RepID=A0A813G3R6_POLGL|nr:unnamed protein product [Polarella glacialis]
MEDAVPTGSTCRSQQLGHRTEVRYSLMAVMYVSGTKSIQMAHEEDDEIIWTASLTANTPPRPLNIIDYGAARLSAEAFSPHLCLRASGGGDVMPAYLTVEEVVMFHSALKEEFPSKLDRKSQRMVTDKRLRVLGLADVKKSYVGDPKQGIRGISGGQRRRLSLARGLASGAQLIFCDEPTSGLSATDAETCVRYMRQVAHKYRVTVIISIHQPRREVARMFDHLLMLTSNPGRAIYQGPMRDLPAHAEKVGFPLPERSNPTDFFMDWITPSTSTSRVDQFDQYFTEHCRPAIDALVDAELLTERKTSMEILEACRQRIMVFGEVPPVRNSKFGASFAPGAWCSLECANRVPWNVSVKFLR